MFIKLYYHFFSQGQFFLLGFGTSSSREIDFVFSTLGFASCCLQAGAYKLVIVSWFLQAGACKLVLASWCLQAACDTFDHVRYERGGVQDRVALARSSRC